MTRVVNPMTGDRVPCCWADCWNDGQDEIKIVKHTDGANLHYIFCSELHKQFYMHSHLSYGNLN